MKILVGLLLCFGGIISTISSYNTAGPGGSYTISVGLILGGAIIFLTGIIQRNRDG